MLNTAYHICAQVEIIDIDDHLPEFLTSTYELDIYEGDSLRVRESLPHAADGDSGENVDTVYEVMEGDRQGRCK